MPKNTATHVDLIDLEGVKQRTRDIIKAAEELLPALATLQRDKDTMSLRS